MSAANNFPSELISLIISYLQVPDAIPTNGYEAPKQVRIATYATVSKEWQKSVERHTFSKLQVTPARIEEFGRAVHGQRLRYLRHIDLVILLDKYSKAVCGRYETDEDRERNNQIFTQTLQKLFRVMSSWERDNVADLGLTLSITAHSPRDLSQMGKKGRRNWIRGSTKDILNRRFDKSYLQFIFAGNKGDENFLLDSVSAIKNVQIWCCDRHIWPAACSTIVSRLPQLESLNVSLFDNEKKDLELRKRARNGKIIVVD
jgi:hypothetical protein